MYCDVCQRLNPTTFIPNIHQMYDGCYGRIYLHQSGNLSHYTTSRFHSCCCWNPFLNFIHKTSHHHNWLATSEPKLGGCFVESSSVNHPGMCKRGDELTRNRWSGERAVSVTVHRKLRARISFWTVHPRSTLYILMRRSYPSPPKKR
jgi:hypothetical protein